MTSGTGGAVTNGPMTADLEAQVLAETGLSGAAIGFAIGGITGALPGLTNGNFDLGQFLSGGVAGAAVGGRIGKEQGEKVIAQAMSRDNSYRLLQGARAYNNGLREYNAGLRNKVAVAKKESDAKKREKNYDELLREASGQLEDANARVALRSNAGANQEWDATQRSQYRETIAPLVAQRDSLKRQVDTLARLRSEGMY